MYRLYKTVQKGIISLILTLTIFFGVFQNFTFPFFWENGIQTMDEDDPPSQKPITPEI